MPKVTLTQVYNESAAYEALAASDPSLPPLEEFMNDRLEIIEDDRDKLLYILGRLLDYDIETVVRSSDMRKAVAVLEGVYRGDGDYRYDTNGARIPLQRSQHVDA